MCAVCLSSVHSLGSHPFFTLHDWRSCQSGAPFTPTPRDILRTDIGPLCFPSTLPLWSPLLPWTRRSVRFRWLPGRASSFMTAEILPFLLFPLKGTSFMHLAVLPSSLGCPSSVPDLKFGKIFSVPLPVTPSLWKGKECVGVVQETVRSVWNSQNGK